MGCSLVLFIIIYWCRFMPCLVIILFLHILSQLQLRLLHFFLFITLKGDKKGLVLFGILAGLIWHIHVALLPLLFLIPVSMMMAKIDPRGLKATVFSSSLKISLGIKYDRKYILWAIAFFVFLTLPFWLFEIRHGFQQITGLIESIGRDKNGIKGIERLFLAVDGASMGFAKFITYKWKAPFFAV